MQINSRRDVNRVERTQGGLGKRPSAGEQTAVEGPQGKHVDQLSGAIEQQIERELGINSSGSPDRSRNLGQHQLATDEIGIREISPERVGLGLVADQLDQRRGVGVEERHRSAVATNLVERPTQRPRISRHLQRTRQRRPHGTRHPPLGNQPIQIPSGRRRRTQLGHRPVAIGDNQPLATADPPQIDAQVLAQLRNTH
jgi:hypothetical protein